MDFGKWNGGVIALGFSAFVVGQAGANSATLHDFVARTPQACITGEAPYPPFLPPCKQGEEHDVAVMLGSVSGTAFSASIPNTILDGVEYPTQAAKTPAEVYVVDGRIFFGPSADEPWLPDE
jgi:hypothetical protein